MPRVRILVGAVLALSSPPLLLSVMACKEPAAPGTLVGAFAVEGTLEENTCGQGFAPTPSIAFAAELRRADTIAYWRMGGTGPRSQGTIDADGDFRFRQQSQIDGWAADPVNGIPACRFVQTETIEGHVEVAPDTTDAGPIDAAVSDAGASPDDAGSSDAGPAAAQVMNATNTIEIGVVPGFDCSLALVSTGAGGQFPSLPCRATYSLAGATAD